MEASRPRLAIIIPTLNEEKNLPRVLGSITAQGFDVADVVIVDKFSKDGTQRVARELGARVLEGGPNLGAQRNIGARHVDHDFLFFVDADMELQPGLLAEIQRLIEQGERCIIVPEDSTTDNYWATVRAFERSFFEGDLTIEAARIFSRDDFERLGGYDVALAGCEDWAFAEQMYRIVTPVRTKHRIIHHEGELSLSKMAKKYFRYGKGFGTLSRRDPMLAMRHANPIRPSIRKSLLSLLRRPRLAAGLFILKSVTYSAGLAGLLSEYVESMSSRPRRA